MGQRALDVHPEAVAEIRAARVRYAEHSAETSERFLAEVEKGLERIAQPPKLGLPTFTAHEVSCCVAFRLVSFIVSRTKPSASTR